MKPTFPSTLRSSLAVAVFVAAIALPAVAGAAESGLWLQSPAISPDGRTIAFSYRGNQIGRAHV